MNDRLLKQPVLFYIKNNFRPFAIGLTLLLITNFLDSLTPMVLKIAVDYLSHLAESSSSLNPINELENHKQSLRIALMFFGVMGSLAITRYGWRSFWGRFHTEVAEDLRNRIFKFFTFLGPKFYNKNTIGELMSLITNDVQSFRSGIGPGMLILFDGISLIFIIVPMMIYLDPQWTWKCLIIMPLVPFMISFIMKKIWQYSKNQQDTLSKLTGYTQEVISGIRTIKTFAQENNKLFEYNKVSFEYEKASNKLNFYDSMFGPLMQLAVASGTIILFYVGGVEVITGAKTVGTFVAFQRYINKIIWPMSALGFGFSQFQKGMASFKRIKDMFSNEPVFNKSEGEELVDIKTIEFRKVHFAYETQPILSDINFKIFKGQTIGIFGSVGSGKSTILNLLTRHIEPMSGMILINDKDIKNYKYSEVWKSVKLIPQEPFLFSESVHDNIQKGIESEALNKLSNVDKAEQIKNAIKLVDIEKEMSLLPNGFSSQLGEKGVNLSGGQKQRLALARGIVSNPSVLLLDDTLSAVDVETENNIQKELYRKNPDQIKLIVSHKVKTIMSADSIIVLNSGRIEAIGKHIELINQSKFYKHACELQNVVVKI